MVRDMEANMMNWNKLLDKYSEGDVVIGKVFAHYEYGAYVNFGEPFYGIITVAHMYNKPVNSSEDFPRIGEEVKCVIGAFRLSFRAMNLSYVSLSMKNLDI